MTLIKNTRNEIAFRDMREHLNQLLTLKKEQEIYLNFTDDFFEITFDVLGNRQVIKTEWPFDMRSKSAGFFFENKTEFALFYTSMILASLAQ
jgi:hypothetical protein